MADMLTIREFGPWVEEAVVRTFAEIAFTDVQPSTTGVPAGQPRNVLSIDIMKPVVGTVFMLAPDALKSKLAENIYGPGTDLQEGVLDDTIMETLNILTANFLTARYKQEAQYKLELPQMIFDEVNPDPEKGLLLHFDAEGVPFDLWLTPGGR